MVIPVQTSNAYSALHEGKGSEQNFSIQNNTTFYILQKIQKKMQLCQLYGKCWQTNVMTSLTPEIRGQKTWALHFLPLGYQKDLSFSHYSEFVSGLKATYQTFQLAGGIQMDSCLEYQLTSENKFTMPLFIKSKLQVYLWRAWEQRRGTHLTLQHSVGQLSSTTHTSTIPRNF